MYRSRTTFLTLSASVIAMAAFAIHWFTRVDPALLNQADEVQQALNRKVTPQQAAMETLQQEPLLGSEYRDVIQQRREAIRLARIRAASGAPRGQAALSELAAKRLQARSRANAEPLRVTDGINYAGLRFASRAGNGSGDGTQDGNGAGANGSLAVIAGDGQDTAAIDIAIKDTVAFVAKGGSGVAAGATDAMMSDGNSADRALTKAFNTLGLLQLGSAQAAGLGSISFLKNTYLPDGLETPYIDPKQLSVGKADLDAGLALASVLPFLNETVGSEPAPDKNATDEALDLANLSITKMGPGLLLFDGENQIPLNPPLLVSDSSLPGLFNSLTSDFAAGVEPLGHPGGGPSDTDIDIDGRVTPVPEPSTLALVLTGLVLFAFGCWRRTGANS